MKCPFCSSIDTKVIDTRESGEDVTRRRRECIKCEKRFTTYERVESSNLVVVKKDGRREPFIRDKVKSGIVKACEKRPVSPEMIDKAVDEIESELRNMDTTEVKSSVVGRLVLSKLRKLDKVAYIRFASVYQEFTDLNAFEKEIQSLKKK